MGQERHFLTCSDDCLVEMVIVDDEPMNTLAIELQLTTAKFKKGTFRSFNHSLEALNFIKNTLNRKCCRVGLKLVLTDIEMPGMTGFELA